jgi:hypothetical protein
MVTYVSISSSVKALLPHYAENLQPICALWYTLSWQNLVTACFSSLVQKEYGLAMLPLLGPYYTGHSSSKWQRVQACIGMHNEEHSQYNKIWENFFTIISASLMYLINKHTYHINSRLWWCNGNYQNLNWVPFFLLENYGFARIKNTPFTVYKYVYCELSINYYFYKFTYFFLFLVFPIFFVYRML